jgi:hypothetical protein
VYLAGQLQRGRGLRPTCTSPGNCSAGGGYAQEAGVLEAFVVSQVNGTWGKAKEVPGTATLNTKGYAQISSVSCASAGNCSAGGYYTDSSNAQQAFVVNQVNGTWGKAKEAPGTATLNKGAGNGINGITSVSCASAGNCSGGGDYTGSSGNVHAFVLSQVNGTWGKAQEVPGTATFSPRGAPGGAGISCAAAGDCSAGGSYTSSKGPSAFVLSQINGTWGKAEEVPGIAALNTGGDAVINSLSCTSPGNCSAGGYYGTTSPVNGQAFVVRQVNGTWGKAEEVPGTAALNTGVLAGITSVSCASAGNCSAGGYYTDLAGHHQVFVVSQTWTANTASLAGHGDLAGRVAAGQPTGRLQSG